MKGTMVIDGQKVEFDGEKNILDVIRKAGIVLPTFCYHSELSIYGACRMCMVEDKWGRPMAACSSLPKDGLEIFTNTPSLQKHRRMILELILANHHRDCTTCEKNGKCKLQELATRFGIRRVRFGSRDQSLSLDKSSSAIVRNPDKCILCGDCVRMCEEIQSMGVLGFAYRGSRIKVTPAFEASLSESECVNCGQCAAVCPTGAIVVKNETEELWSLLYNPAKRVVAQIAPAVRVSLGEEFGLPAGEVVTGKVVAALKKLGFDEVYDTSLAADLTVLEESHEFMERLKKGTALPLFTSCCPAWVRYVETKHPDLLPHISTCRSPQQMFGALIKEHFRTAKDEDSKDTVVVSIMPCTAKKAEAARPEYTINGERDVDLVITTQELATMIREAGILFNELDSEALDMPFGLSSGAGILFGATGGVAEAVLRKCYGPKNSETLKQMAFSGVRGMEGIKEISVELEDRVLNFAIVHGLKNATDLLESIRKGKKHYDFVEVMACPGGCIGGAGQPLPFDSRIKEMRAKGIYQADRVSQIKRSEENPVIMALYNGILREKRHLLHVSRRDEPSCV